MNMNFSDSSLEVERKFRVKNNLNYRLLKEQSKDILDIQQSYYLDPDDGINKRVRIQKSLITGNNKTVFCVKTNMGKVNNIPLIKEIETDDIFQVGVNIISGNHLDFISKTRYIVNIDGYDFEIDKYNNLSAPFDNLITAEVEFKNEEELNLFNKIKLPSFIDYELTGQKEYSNINLVKHINKNIDFPYKINQIPTSKIVFKKVKF